jgi:hypothetical protein
VRHADLFANIGSQLVKTRNNFHTAYSVMLRLESSVLAGALLGIAYWRIA